jgi:hypothetical protein
VSDIVHHTVTITANTAGGHGLTITFGDLHFITCQRHIIAVDGDGNGVVDFYLEAAQSVTGLSLTPPPYVPVAESPFVPVALGTTKTVHLTVHQIAPGEYAVTCDIDGVVVTGTAIVPSQTLLLGTVYSINLAVFDAVANSPLPFAEAPASGTFSGFSLSSAAPAVGGMVELRAGPADPASRAPASSGRDYVGPMVAGMAGMLAIAAGAWYARRHWLR